MYLLLSCKVCYWVFPPNTPRYFCDCSCFAIIILDDFSTLPSVSLKARQACSFIVCWTAGLDAEHTRQHLYTLASIGPVVAGSPGASIVQGLKPATNETVLVKKRFSPFFGTHLDLLLRRCTFRNARFVPSTHLSNKFASKTAQCRVQRVLCVRLSLIREYRSTKVSSTLLCHASHQYRECHRYACPGEHRLHG
jgi:hypothetical protein